MNSTFEQMQKEHARWDALLAEKEDRFLTWKDLSAEDIQRFCMESSGRCFAANPSADIILAPLRRVYDDYYAKAEAEAESHLWFWNAEPSDPSWPSTVRLSELKAAVALAEEER